MRAGPSGEEQCTPHYTVPVSPQCPQEISLLTLPVFQGAAVSSEHFSQSLPPRNVAELRGSPPSWGSLGQLERPSPASLAALSTPEASLERLVPLVDYSAAWKLLPNVSRWIMHTIEQGYRGALLPPFNGVTLTLVVRKQDLVMEQEVSTLLRKEAIEVVPPLDEESGFYSRTSLFLGKGLRPFLDLSKLNHSVTRLKFRKLSSSTCLTPDPRTGGHEQSRRCILLPHHMKFLSLGAKRINIGFFPLALHSRPSSERMAVRQRDVILAHLKELGLRLNVRKVCFSNTENLLSGRGVGSDHDAGTYVPCSDRVNPHVSQESKRRPVTHCQAVSKLLGLMSAVSNVIHFGLLYMIPLQWRLKTKGFSPRGKSTLHDQGHAAMPTCLRHVEETLGFCLKAWCWELLFAT